jgi:hypothetical protein
MPPARVPPANLSRELQPQPIRPGPLRLRQLYRLNQLLSCCGAYARNLLAPVIPD